MTKTFKLSAFKSTVHIQSSLPSLNNIISELGGRVRGVLLICDENTINIAKNISLNGQVNICVIKAGETAKTWESVESILRSAKEAGIGRDGLFIGVGGGVISDIAAFAASVFMRGVNLVIISTTLLGMADASLGGKTGIDLFDIKNIAGTFYPASLIYMPISVLTTLPLREWKSGMAEIIKTLILNKTIYKKNTYECLISIKKAIFDNQTFLDNNHSSSRDNKPDDSLIKNISSLIKECVLYKGRITETDLYETKGKRALLNLGHTFGHALETSCGLGVITHGEAVAWGIVRSCELGVRLGITSIRQKDTITNCIELCGYETKKAHPLIKDNKTFINSLNNDKKKKSGNFNFIIPVKKGVEIINIKPEDMGLIENIIFGKTND
ncbi:3-dehydroquinate synthase [Spirochaetia bacterium]|nr:3-dehydroquinate synthase [Spirochaetia bacterium]